MNHRLGVKCLISVILWIFRISLLLNSYLGNRGQSFSLLNLISCPRFGSITKYLRLCIFIIVLCLKRKPITIGKILTCCLIYNKFKMGLLIVSICWESLIFCKLFLAPRDNRSSEPLRSFKLMANSRAVPLGVTSLISTYCTI